MKDKTRDILGFDKVLAAMPAHPTDAQHDYVHEFGVALERAAADRGLSLKAPSDALDQSRDLVIDEAARALSAGWEIRDDTLLLTHDSLAGVVDWEKYLA